jgi:hypothetical protein
MVSEETMKQGEASIRVSKALRIVGSIGLVLGISTVLFSSLLYIRQYGRRDVLDILTF